MPPASTSWWASRSPRSSRCAARPAARYALLLLGVELLQGTIGFVQYFTDLPVALVAAHLVGAAILVAAGTRLVLAVSSADTSRSVRPREPERILVGRRIARQPSASGRRRRARTRSAGTGGWRSRCRPCTRSHSGRPAAAAMTRPTSARPTPRPRADGTTHMEISCWPSSSSFGRMATMPTGAAPPRTVLGHEAGPGSGQSGAPVLLAVLVAGPALDRRGEGLRVLRERALTEQAPDHPVVGADLADPHRDPGLERPVADSRCVMRRAEAVGGDRQVTVDRPCPRGVRPPARTGRR